MSIWQRAKDHLIGFLARFVVPCSLVTQRLSDRLQRPLTLRERLSNLMHMSICVWCRRYQHQLTVVHSAVHNVAANPDRLPPSQDGLSSEARDRIRRAFDQADQSPDDTP